MAIALKCAREPNRSLRPLPARDEVPVSPTQHSCTTDLSRAAQHRAASLIRPALTSQARAYVSASGDQHSSSTHDRVARATQTSASNAPVRGGKTTTGIAGLPVHSRPLPELKLIYQETLEALGQLPAGTAYRQATEALTRHRIEVIERNSRSNGGELNENAIEAVERELELGQIEEVVTIAEGELSLARKFLSWRPWEELVEKPPAGTYAPFGVYPSNTNPE